MYKNKNQIKTNTEINYSDCDIDIVIAGGRNDEPLILKNSHSNNEGDMNMLTEFKKSL